MLKGEGMTRVEKVRNFIIVLEEVQKDFPSNNIGIDTAIRSYKSQLKELEK